MEIRADGALRFCREFRATGENRGARPSDRQCREERSSARAPKDFSRCGRRCRIRPSSPEPIDNPVLACSSPRLISMRTGRILPTFSAAAFSFSASFTESMESTASKNSAAFAALFDCKCPIRCQSASVRSRKRRLYPQTPARGSRQIREGPRRRPRALIRRETSCSPHQRDVSRISPGAASSLAIRSRMRAMFSTMDTVEI